MKTGPLPCSLRVSPAFHISRCRAFRGSVPGGGPWGGASTAAAAEQGPEQAERLPPQTSWLRGRVAARGPLRLDGSRPHGRHGHVAVGRDPHDRGPGRVVAPRRVVAEAEGAPAGRVRRWARLPGRSPSLHFFPFSVAGKP